MVSNLPNPFIEKILKTMTCPPSRLKEVFGVQPLAPISNSLMMNAFKKRIEKAIENQEKILVAGDYDCDGMMSTAIFVQGLKALNLKVGYYIPDRMKEGYGLSSKTVQMAAERGYKLIVTCDNGVKAHEALSKAEELGVEVIVTDHHLIQEEVKANILIHPSTLEEPFYSLCGAGIALECMRALGQDLDRFYIWAAIASIADCMEVFGQTRAIIQKGLALFNEQGEIHLDPFVRATPIDERDAAFQIAPKINALGRLCNLAKANTFIQYLELTNDFMIQDYANKVCELNEMRKELTKQVYGQAQLFIKPMRPVLLAYDPSFHEGIIGLAAGNLTSQFNKPAIVCTVSEGGYKCSMRAPKGFHCLEFLGDFSHYSALGGHAQAAGFGVSFAYWNEFEEFFNKQSYDYKWNLETTSPIEIEPSDMTLENVHALDCLRPFGTGFELPLFRINQPQIVSTFDLSQGLHRKFTLQGGLQALHFNQGSLEAAMDINTIEAFIGRPSINRFKGKEKVDFLIEEIIYR